MLNWLEQEILRAEQDFLLHTGNENACQLHKDGRVTGGMKYDEGRLVVLMTVRRIVRVQDAWEPEQLAETLENERAKWHKALDTYQNAAHPSIPWLAYSQGGVDEIEKVLTALLSQSA